MHARPHFRIPARFIAAALAALLSVACEKEGTDFAHVVSVVVSPTPSTLAIGATQQFTATVKDENGAISVIAPTWTVATGGTINSTGLFTAGTVAATFANTVTATVDGVSGMATVIVTPGAAASLVLTPTPVTLAIGATQQFTAVLKDANGNVTTGTPTFTATGNAGTITTAGLFTAGTVAGTYTSNVTATLGSLTGLASVTVTPGALANITVATNPTVLAAGTTAPFTATGTDAYGNAVAFSPVWSVVAGGGLIASGGTFTAGGSAGTFVNTVRACSTAACGAGSISGSATVRVTAGGLASITVTPNPVDVGTGASQQFTAVGRDASGNVIAISPAPTWSVATGHSGGTVSSSGNYTAPGAAGPGIDSVFATSGSISGAARVNVTTSQPLATITVTPNPANVPTGGTQQFSATGRDGTGAVVPTPGLTWSVVASGGSINSAGLFTAGGSTGTFTNTVQATSGSTSGNATVNVTGAAASGPPLGAADTHGILAGSAITCASAPGTINADVSVWPGSAITGFPPCVITGARHAADAFAQTAQGDLTTAYNALAAMPCGTTITADLGGTTLAEGVYCSTSSVGVTGTVTLTGNANSVFVIKAASTLITAGSVIMAGGAQAKNVYWLVGSSATLGNNSAWQGNVVAFTTITLNNNVTLVGRALARNGGVSLGTNDVIILP
jgi:hypothetical protein